MVHYVCFSGCKQTPQFHNIGLMLGFFFFFLFSFYSRTSTLGSCQLGVESELKLPAYTTATAMPDLSCNWDLHGGSWQHHILNPLSEVRDQTCILVHTGWVLNLLSLHENSNARLLEHESEG